MSKPMTDDEFDELGRKQLEDSGITVAPGDRESFAAAMRASGVPEHLVQQALEMSPEELIELVKILKDSYIQGQVGNRPEWV